MMSKYYNRMLHFGKNSHVNYLNPLIYALSRRHFWYYARKHIWQETINDENVWILIKISLKFVHKGPIDYIPVLVQIMVWRRSGDKPLSELMLIILPTHIYASLGLNELKEWRLRSVITCLLNKKGGWLLAPKIILALLHNLDQALSKIMRIFIAGLWA